MIRRVKGHQRAYASMPRHFSLSEVLLILRKYQKPYSRWTTAVLPFWSKVIVPTFWRRSPSVAYRRLDVFPGKIGLEPIIAPPTPRVGSKSSPTTEYQ